MEVLSVRRTEVLICMEDGGPHAKGGRGSSSVRRTGVLICKEGWLPALRITFCLVSAAALERLSVTVYLLPVCTLVCVTVFLLTVCLTVLFVNCHNCLCLGVDGGHNGADDTLVSSALPFLGC